MIKYPYQDCVSMLLPGEDWKDIPDFEGYYRASNLGRVKSLDRTIPHPRLKTQFVKGRILSQSISKNKNTTSKEAMVDLRVSLNYENKAYYFNVRRVVYTTFVKKLDFKKEGLIIVNIDCNGFNNRLENLEAITKSEKVRRASKRKRVPRSYLAYADRSQWGNKLYGGKARSKPIQQLDMEGNLIRQYESIKQASRETGYGEKEIIMAAKGRWKQYNGFLWKYV